MSLKSAFSKMAGRFWVLPSIEGQDALTLLATCVTAAEKDKVRTATGACQACAVTSTAVRVTASRVAIAGKRVI